jgi:hypothetical protein
MALFGGRSAKAGNDSVPDSRLKIPRGTSNRPSSDRLASVERHLKGALTRIEELTTERDGLQQEKDDHVCATAHAVNECPGCGVFYIPGPHACQRCGYAPWKVEA